MDSGTGKDISTVTIGWATTPSCGIKKSASNVGSNKNTSRISLAVTLGISNAQSNTSI